MPTPKKAIAKRKKTTPAKRRESNPAREITSMIRAAITQGVPEGVMREFVQLHREIKADYAREQYFEALAKFQGEVPTVLKTRNVLNRDGSIRYRYASLDQIKDAVQPVLQKYGFSFSILASQEGDVVTSTVRIHRKGHTEETSFSVPIDTGMSANAPQKVAAALTFTKRYAFCNGLGILTGDEDLDGTTPTEPDVPPTDPKAAGDVSQLYEDICLLLEKNPFSDEKRRMWTDKAQKWFDEGSLTGLQSVHGTVAQQVTRMKRGNK